MPPCSAKTARRHGICSSSSVTTLATALGVTRQASSNALNANTDLFAELAIRLEKLLGISADTLIPMQARYNLSQAHAHEEDIKVRELAA